MLISGWWWCIFHQLRPSDCVDWSRFGSSSDTGSFKVFLLHYICQLFRCRIWCSSTVNSFRILLWNSLCSVSFYILHGRFILHHLSTNCSLWWVTIALVNLIIHFTLFTPRPLVHVFEVRHRQVLCLLCLHSDQNQQPNSLDGHFVLSHRNYNDAVPSVDSLLLNNWLQWLDWHDNDRCNYFHFILRPTHRLQLLWQLWKHLLQCKCSFTRVNFGPLFILPLDYS